MTEPQELRRLAAWYREFAERAGSSWIWEARLRPAGELDKEAARLENEPARSEVLSPQTNRSTL
jgi:hypothetical protein